MKSQIKKRKDNGKEGRKREHMGRKGKRGGAACCMLWSWKPDWVVWKWRHHRHWRNGRHTYRKAGIEWDVPLTLMEGACSPSQKHNTTRLLRVYQEEGLISSKGGLCRGVVWGYKLPAAKSCGGCFLHTPSTLVLGPRRGLLFPWAWSRKRPWVPWHINSTHSLRTSSALPQ